MSISVILFMIIGVLCTLYGVMILLIHSGTSHSWSTAILLKKSRKCCAPSFS